MRNRTDAYRVREKSADIRLFGLGTAPRGTKTSAEGAILRGFSAESQVTGKPADWLAVLSARSELVSGTWLRRRFKSDHWRAPACFVHRLGGRNVLRCPAVL